MRITELQVEQDFPLEKTKAFLETNCSNALSSTPIWRGVSGPPVIFLDTVGLPPRHAANTTNTSNLLLQVMPAWKAFPRRSVICTTDRMYAGGYGPVYRVFPVNGTKIGVCPGMDFWQLPFLKAITDSFNSLNTLNISLENYAHNISRMTLEGDDPQILIGQLKQLARDWIQQRSDRRFYSRAVKDENSILERLYEILDPANNHFTQITIGEGIPPKREVWFDGKALLVQEKECWKLGIKEFK